MELKIEYDAPGGRTELPAGGLPEGIAVLCQHEIEAMRQTLAALGEELAVQLSDGGGNVLIHRDWTDRWSRGWHDGGTSFQVDAAQTRMSERMNGCEGASDVALVRGTITSMIEQREQIIRQMYGTILNDALARRQVSASPAAGQLD